MLGFSELCLSLHVLPEMENVHSDMELEGGIDSMARAIIEKESTANRHHGKRPTSCLTSPS